MNFTSLLQLHALLFLDGLPNMCRSVQIFAELCLLTADYGTVLRVRNLLLRIQVYACIHCIYHIVH